MELNKFSGKKIRIVCKDGEVYAGLAYDYVPPQDNEPKVASITINSVEIFENEIESIKEINPNVVRM